MTSAEKAAGLNSFVGGMRNASWPVFRLDLLLTSNSVSYAVGLHAANDVVP